MECGSPKFKGWPGQGKRGGEATAIVASGMQVEVEEEEDEEEKVEVAEVQEEGEEGTDEVLDEKQGGAAGCLLSIPPSLFRQHIQAWA